MARRRRQAEEEQPEPTNRIQIEYLSINDVHEYDNNPRDNEPAIDSVAESIERFGFTIPIVVDEDNVIVAGHTRVAAARRLGMSDVPAIRASWLDEAQVKAFRIIDNKVAELAAWDNDLLAGEISALADSGIPFTRLGFTQEEIDCLSDVVQDDCLSIGISAHTRNTPMPEGGTRTPATTRLVLGDIMLFIPSPVYRMWATDLRNECDFDEAVINERIKTLLGITPYEQEYETESCTVTAD